MTLSSGDVQAVAEVVAAAVALATFVGGMVRRRRKARDVGHPAGNADRSTSAGAGIGLILLLSVLGGAVAGAVPYVVHAWVGSVPAQSPAPTPKLPATATATSMASPTPSCTHRFTLDSPVEGQAVKGSDGVLVHVTVCDRHADEFGWVFDYDPSDGYFYRDNDQPIAQNGPWVYNDQPIGDPSEHGTKVYVVVLYVGDDACNATIARAEPDADGDVKLKSLPTGAACFTIDRRNVPVTWR